MCSLYGHEKPMICMIFWTDNVYSKRIGTQKNHLTFCSNEGNHFLLLKLCILITPTKTAKISIRIIWLQKRKGRWNFQRCAFHSHGFTSPMLMIAKSVPQFLPYCPGSQVFSPYLSSSLIQTFYWQLTLHTSTATDTFPDQVPPNFHGFRSWRRCFFPHFNIWYLCWNKWLGIKHYMVYKILSCVWSHGSSLHQLGRVNGAIVTASILKMKKQRHGRQTHKRRNLNCLPSLALMPRQQLSVAEGCDILQRHLEW